MSRNYWSVLTDRLREIGKSVLSAKPFALITTGLPGSSMEKLEVMQEECMQYKLLKSLEDEDMRDENLARKVPLLIRAEVPTGFNCPAEEGLHGEMLSWRTGHRRNVHFRSEAFGGLVQDICNNFKPATRPPRAVFRPRQAGQPVGCDRGAWKEAHLQLLDILYRVPLATWVATGTHGLF